MLKHLLAMTTVVAQSAAFAAVFSAVMPANAQSATAQPAAVKATPAFIPLPVAVQISVGTAGFALGDTLPVRADGDAGKAVRASLAVAGLKFADAAPGEHALTAAIDPARKETLGAEGYVLVVSSEAVTLTAAAPAGLFYGVQTLAQAVVKDAAGKPAIPSLTITDTPRFAWRGFMLDSSRHFQTIGEIQRWLDLMAMHKLNVFHWHLVDDHGWRFESKKYPLLTQVGAWREQPPIGRYGGFYTQDEMRAIVAYAAERHITVLPEIEMPGHSRAALAAYPNLACGGVKTEVDHFFSFPMGAQAFPGIPGSNVYCAANPATFRFLEDIMTEVMAIFPSPYIHVGGDEVGMGFWNNCADCLAERKKNNLANGHKQQAQFMGRMEKFLNTHGRKMIGWDEILEGGLSPNATVMSWRGISGGIKAAKSGHDAVMSPQKPFYLDHRQSKSPLHPSGFGGSIETLEEGYLYDPIPKELTPAEARHILGTQANLWTCSTPDKERLELFAFPRFCALAETAWCQQSAKDFAVFQKRLDAHLPRLDALGVNYWREPAPVTLGGWRPDPKLKDWAPLEFDLTGKLSGGGDRQVTFQFQSGKDALEIQSVELLADGRVIATDRHPGLAGSRHENNSYTIQDSATTTAAKLTLRAVIRGMSGKTDSTGTVTLNHPVKRYASLRARDGLRSTTPVTQNRDGKYDWMARHQQVLAQLKATPPQVVMIGDSITHLWGGTPTTGYQAVAADAWRRAFDGHTVANLGFASDRTENVLWRIAHGELDGIAPARVVLLIGINNIGAGDSVADVTAGIETVCLRIHEKLPAARLLVLGILPCSDLTMAEKADRVNFHLQTRLQPQGWISVHDLGNKFRNPDGTFNGKLFADGVHPNAAGYEVLADYLKTAVK